MLQKIVTGKYAVVLFTLLCAFHFRFGIIPGWNKIVSDFPNYYCSSKLIASGKDASMLYYDGQFNNEIAANGISAKGQFSLYPPHTALLLMPLVNFTPMEAKRIWMVINIFLVLGCIILIKNMLDIPFFFAGNLLLLTGFCLTNDLMLGQVYVLMLFLTLLGYLLMVNNRQWMAGISWGIVMALKYFTVVMIPVLLFKKKWNTLLGLFVSFILINSCGVLIMGTEVYGYFFKTVFLKHLAGTLNSQPAFAIQFQSFESLFNNLFVRNEVWNPTPFYESAFLFSVFRIATVIVLLFFSWMIIGKAGKHAYFFEIAGSVLAVLLLLLEPGSATYHLVFLVFPVVLSARFFLSNGHRNFTEMLLVATGAIGFISVAVNKLAANYQWPLLLQYSRLWFLLLFFGILLYCLNRALKSKARSVA